ncbi:MAG: hypothetical protein QXF42_01145 [Sulfolobales archaeon]
MIASIVGGVDGVKLLRNLRGVLTSRKFFSNWWVLPLKFVSGADKFEVRCRDGGSHP